MLNRILEQRARADGSRDAVVFGRRRYSYAQVQEGAARLAAGLKGWGVEAGRGVALLLKNSPEFVVTYLAASHLGAPALLLDPGSKLLELRRVFSEHEVAGVICEAEQVAILEQVRETAGQDFQIFARSEGFERLLARATEPAPRKVYGDETAIVQYTSGSTGTPKCVARSHLNLFWEAKDFNETVRVCADDRIFCTIPLFHAHGFGNAFLAALYAGASLVLMSEFNRGAALELLTREQISIFPGVPLIFDLLTRYVHGGPNRPRNSLRLAFSAGAHLSPEVARGFQREFGSYIRQLYGSTELGSASINLDPNPEPTLDSVGQPIKNVRIEILRENGTPAREGEIGEVAIQSPAMPPGYHQQPELTRQKFRDRFFWPGDLGRKCEEGHLYIQGRADWLISSAGRKVDPIEVECVIASHPKVREVAVVGVPGYLEEQVVKAVVVLHESCAEHEIVDFCRDKLADFKIPRLVEFVTELPHSMSGKTVRKELV